jgi:hypothetical protein
VATVIVQKEKQDLPTGWDHLWSRLAEIYVCALAPNGNLSHADFLGCQVIGNAQNRVGSMHRALSIRDLLKQFRRNYLEACRANSGKPTSQQVKKAFSTIKTKGHEKYAGVVAPLAKLEDKELYHLVESLLSEDPIGGTTKTTSTAPFNGMFAKWNKVRIPAERQKAVLGDFASGVLQQKQMLATWAFEFNKVLFIHSVNTTLGTRYPYSNFEGALSEIPLISREQITEILKTGGKIKVRNTQPIVMPQKIDAMLQYLKEQKAQVIFWDGLFLTNLGTQT